MPKVKKKFYCDGCVFITKNKYCDMQLELITDETWKRCKRCGYKIWRISRGTGKVSHKPPCP